MSTLTVAEFAGLRDKALQLQEKAIRIDGDVERATEDYKLARKELKKLGFDVDGDFDVQLGELEDQLREKIDALDDMLNG